MSRPCLWLRTPGCGVERNYSSVSGCPEVHFLWQRQDKCLVFPSVYKLVLFKKIIDFTASFKVTNEFFFFFFFPFAGARGEYR